MADDQGRSGRGGGWRSAFLNRHRKSDEPFPDGDDGQDSYEADRERRSLSRPRAGSRPRATSRTRTDAEVPAGEAFNQQAYLDADRALIEQLTQRAPQRERSAVRKPPPPPKVAPYRASSVPRTPVTSQAPQPPFFDNTMSSQLPEPDVGFAIPQQLLDSASPPASFEQCPTETGMLAAALMSCGAPAFSNTFDETALGARSLGATAEMLAASVMALDTAAPLASPVVSIPPATAASKAIMQNASDISTTANAGPAQPPLKPVVPRTGGLFTSSDIDSIMDTFGQSMKQANDTADPSGGDKVGMFEQVFAAPAAQVTQNFNDLTNDFFESHQMEVPTKIAASKPATEAPMVADFKVPERKALREQINAMDSWLEDDFSARDRMQKEGTLPGAPPALAGIGAQFPMDGGLSATNHDLVSMDASDAGIFHKLEDAKRRKALGERTSPVTLNNIAKQAKPLFPGFPLEKLVRSLRLFTSARCEDHDLYLRILGEIPVQIRGITTDMLTTCVRILWRLRLREETYVELFSMEAMNMIRAKRRPTLRAPRRPPAPRQQVDVTTTAALGTTAPVPTPPVAAPQDSLSPFSAEQLIHLGNSLSRLGSSHAPRFLEIYQEQLALAIPRLRQEECELVCPTLAMSQLMHDPLRRAFLERCAQVDAGKSLDELSTGAAPDIAAYQKETDQRRKRSKYFRNIFVIEASIRKETFSFFASLPTEVRTYLDRLHAGASELAHEGTSTFSAQVAAVLDQLGVNCDLSKMQGPIGLHVVVKSTNRADSEQTVYECSDTTAYYSLPGDDKGAAPQLTTWSKIRHRMLQRLGVQLVHISIWEWQQMTEAQRVNYMVKLQLPALQ